MSTKTKESCAQCQAQCLPTDNVIAMDYDQYGDKMPVKFWRYQCNCGNIWANEAQRKHNEIAHRQARSWAREIYG